MPYKDPERERQWEREHREQRNERRRIPRSDVPSEPSRAAVPTPDPVSDQESQGTWIALLALAVAIGVVLLGAFAGAGRPHTGTLGVGRPGQNPGR